MTELYKYVFDKMRSKHLTIGDLRNLGVGDSLDVVIWDGKFEEYDIWRGSEKNMMHLAKNLLEQYHYILKYNGDLTWDIMFPFGQTFKYTIHLDVSNLDTNWEWAEINRIDGMIYIESKILKKNQHVLKSKLQSVHWSEFPDNTRIGWRGPIILWKDLNLE